MSSIIAQKISTEHTLHLQGSGLNERTMINAGLFSVDKEESQGLLKMSNAGSGIVFPYPYVEGFVRIRLDEPIYSSKQDDGYGNVRRQREIRYLSPKGSSNHLYLPVSKEVLEATGSQLYIAEGEKKTLSLIQAGLSAIGVAGVWSWRTKKDTVDEFNIVNWKRPVTIVFDSDVTTRREVRTALKALADELTDRGAEVSICITPQSLGGAFGGK